MVPNIMRIAPPKTGHDEQDDTCGGDGESRVNARHAHQTDVARTGDSGNNVEAASENARHSLSDNGLLRLFGGSDTSLGDRGGCGGRAQDFNDAADGDERHDDARINRER